MKNVLINESPLTVDILHATLDRSPSMWPDDTRDVLIANSPLPTEIYDRVVAWDAPLFAAQRNAVLDAQ